MKTINERIAYAIEKSPLTQAELAERVGKSAASVSRWVSGESKPTGRGTKEKIANELRISLEWLEFGIGEMRSDSRFPLDGKPLFKIQDSAIAEPEEDYQSRKEHPAKEAGIPEEPSLDDLPRLIRLRDMIQDKIDKLVGR